MPFSKLAIAVDGVPGAKTAAAVNHAFTTQIGPGQADAKWRTGKLTEADWQRLDASLRSEAAAILKRLDAVQPDSAAAG